jgi:hypothetical protein
MFLMGGLYYLRGEKVLKQKTGTVSGMGKNYRAACLCV